MFQPNVLASLLFGMLAAAAFGSAPLTARDQGIWPVKGKLIGKKDKKGKDVSGIACTKATGFPRHCLIIDDEVQHAQLVTLHDGELVVGETVPLIADKLNDKPLEFDGESVAYDDGYFYVIGSHGHPRDKDKELDPKADAAKIKASITANSKVVRIRVDAPIDGISPGSTASPKASEVLGSDKLRGLIAADATLAPFMDKRLDANGVTVEGIAVWKGRLFAGFRGPLVKQEWAAVLSAAVGHFFTGEPADAKLHLLPLGPGRGVRDLVSFGNGLLILAGPSADGDGEYAVYRWDGSGDRVKLLGTLPEFRDKKGQHKPEAILPLDQGAAGLRLLVLLDGAEEGAPRTVVVSNP